MKPTHLFSQPAVQEGEDFSAHVRGFFVAYFVAEELPVIGDALGLVDLAKVSVDSVQALGWSEGVFVAGE